MLAEVCDGLAAQSNQRRWIGWRGGGTFRVVHDSDELFERGFALYRQRPDKDWSLTDALTTDHHFEQAGFTALLA